MKMNFNRPLILASKSPRRRQLLSEAGFEFDVRTKEVAENYPADLDYKEVASYLAAKKASALLPEIEDEIIIASDTIVVCDGHILGKPTNQQDEIDHYIAKFSPYDKAGSYGIQEWIGMIGITKITGSYYTVMGLPVHRLYEELMQF